MIEKRRRRRLKSGQGMVETALVMGLIAILCVGSLWLMAEYFAEKQRQDAEKNNAAQVVDEFDEMMDDLGGVTSGVSGDT